MTWPEMMGLATGGLTVAGALVALTRYITNLQLQVRLERSEIEKSQSERAGSDLEAAKKLLLEELAAVRRVGGAVSAKKGEIDDELRELVKLQFAESGSVYLPLNNSRYEAYGLVFLAIEPVNETAMTLRKQVIELQSNAGRCFTTGQSFVVEDAKHSQDHNTKADQVSGYKTRDLLNVPLRWGGRVVGVLQLLNKIGGDRFSEKDLKNIEDLSKTIASKVGEFSLLPGNLELLGFVPQTEPRYGTIMFCDLTASSVLFQKLNVSAAVRHINEYLEVLCNVAFRYGATVDKYLGDGVIFRFNVPHQVDDAPLKAVRAALDMTTAFAAIKKNWQKMHEGEGVDQVFTRAGLAYGELLQANVGHPQYQYLTVFGKAVNLAGNLCDSAARDHNVVVIDQALYEQVSRKVRLNVTQTNNLGKAGTYTSAAYEVDSISDNT